MDLSFIDKDAVNDFIDIKTRCYKNCEKELSYNKFDNGLILPRYQINGGGCFTNENTFIDSSGAHLGIGGWYKTEEQIDYYDGTYIYISWVPKVWGHSFTDAIKKIWFIWTEECTNFIREGAKYVYVADDNCLPNNNIVAIFRLLGIDLKKCILVQKPMRCRSLIIPDDSLSGDYNVKYYTIEYEATIRQLKSSIKLYLDNAHLEIPTYNKVYFSRTKIPARKKREFGEIGIEKAFRKMGYMIIYPEKLSFFEQVYLLQSCSHFASTEGSISHNALFCNPSTVVEIVRKSKFINLYQIIINEIAQVEPIYIDAHKSINLWAGMEWWGPFFMNVNKNLCNYLGRDFYFISRPYWLYYEWWYQMLINRSIFKRIRSAFMKIGIDINPFWWGN